MLDISNVVRISTMTANAGLSNANTSALALVTHDKPLFGNYGDFRVYLDSISVAKDFGASSRAAAIANTVFSQVPNITSSGGYLIIIPLLGEGSESPAVILTTGWDFSNGLPNSYIDFLVSGTNANATLPATGADLGAIQTAFNESLNQYGIQVTVTGDILSAIVMFSTTAVGSNASLAVQASNYTDLPDIAAQQGIIGLTATGANGVPEPAVLTIPNLNLSVLQDEASMLGVNISGQQNSISLTSLDVTDINSIASDLNSAINSYGLSVAITGTLTAATVTFTTTNTGKATSLALFDTGSGLQELTDVFGTPPAVYGKDNTPEQLKEAILRTIEKVYYFGIMFDEISDLPYTVSRLKEVAQLVQSLDKILFVSTNIRDRVTDNYQSIADGGFSHTRCLYYGGSMDDAITFQAAYASLAMSVNFSRENSAITMNGKVLNGIAADKKVDQTFFFALKAAGTDLYGDFGVPRVMSNGANEFYDDVLNILAMKLTLQIETFNALTATPNKIPQTEIGMNFLKSNIRQVLEKFVRAGVVAPGAWNSSTTYGSAEKHVASIKQLGYWVYSTPLSQQSHTERSQRLASPIYIAVKFAGAIHTVDLVFYVEV